MSKRSSDFLLQEIRAILRLFCSRYVFAPGLSYLIFVISFFMRLTRVHALELRPSLTNPSVTGRVLVLYGEVTGRVLAWCQSGRCFVTGRGMHCVKLLLSRKRVR